MIKDAVDDADETEEPDPEWAIGWETRAIPVMELEESDFCPAGFLEEDDVAAEEEEEGSPKAQFFSKNSPKGLEGSELDSSRSHFHSVSVRCGSSRTLTKGIVCLFVLVLVLFWCCFS